MKTRTITELENKAKEIFNSLENYHSKEVEIIIKAIKDLVPVKLEQEGRKIFEGIKGQS